MRRACLLLLTLVPLVAACQSSSPPPTTFKVAPPAFLLFQDGLRTGQFYDWNGRLLSQLKSPAGVRPTNAVYPSKDARYYVAIGDQIQIWKRDGTHLKTTPNLSGTWFPWAEDGDVLCGYQSAQLSLFVLDPSLGFRYIKAAIAGGVQTCSVTTGRAVVLAGERFAVISLSDGHAELTVPLRWQSAGYLFSPDDMWLAEPAILADGRTQGTDVIDLTDGVIAKEMPGLTVLGFTPDSRYLLMTDTQNQAGVRLIDWQTGREIWSTTGSFAQKIGSDPATDKLLVAVRRNGPSDPTLTYLIVSASGVAAPFAPVTS